MDNLKMFDIVYVNMPDRVGSEQSGIHPYVVIQNNMGNKYCPTILGMSLTSNLKKEHLPTHCIIKKTVCNGLKHDSMLLGETVTQISKERIMKKIGCIDDEKVRDDVIGIYIANITGKKKYTSFWSRIILKICRLVKEEENGNAV